MVRVGKWLLAAAGVCICVSVAPAQDSASQRLEIERLMRDAPFTTSVMNRATLLRPGRRDGPPRDVNISDDEVREVQAVSQRYLPSDFVNISPVVTGCPCEEGAECTDQVYVVATSSAEPRGLQLSRVKNKWIVGTVQKWWLRYEELLAKQPTLDWLEFGRAANALAHDFPVCGLGSKVALETTQAGEHAR